MPEAPPRIASAQSIFRSAMRIRTEIAWVAAGKAVEFMAAFGLLKVLTARLGAAPYGEYNLADTSLVLLHAIALVPVHESFLRAYHGARDSGDLRAEMRTLIRGYALVTVSVACIAIVSSPWLAGPLGFHTWTAAAAGLVFFFDRWRFLGLDYRNIRRERRSAALQAGGFQLSLLAAILAAVIWIPTASAALFAYAAMAACWAALGLRRPLTEFRALPPSTSRKLRGMVVAFGIPLAAVLALQWFQSFGDRYLLKGLLDAKTVGLYVAAYQVSGIPYTLMFRVCHELVVPIAYERAGDGSDPARLQAGDMLLLELFAIQLTIGAALLLFYAEFGARFVVLLTSSEFALPGSLVLALACARWVQNLGFALQPIFALHHRTRALLGFRLFGAVVSVSFAAIGIRKGGALGAAIGSASALLLYLAALILAPGGVVSLVRGARRQRQP